MSTPEARPALVLLAILLCACGSQGDGAPVPDVVVAPPPAPSPPSTTPPPSPPPPPAPPGPLIANVSPGSRLSGQQVCATGQATFAPQADGGERLVSISALTGGRLTNNRLTISYLQENMYQTDVNGFGGSRFSPQNMLPKPSRAYDYFRISAEEFELYRNAEHPIIYATFGRWSDHSGICFFAAGAPATSFLVDGMYEFTGLGDGIVVGSGGTRRLFGSTAIVRMDANRRTVQVTLRLSGREAPFGEFLDSAPANLGEATAQLTYAGPEFSVSPLSGPDGATGTITGEIYGNLVSVGLVFELVYPNGDRIIGAIAADLDYEELK